MAKLGRNTSLPWRVEFPRLFVRPRDRRKKPLSRPRLVGYSSSISLDERLIREMWVEIKRMAMIRARFLGSIAVLMLLCGCQSPKNVDMSKSASSGAVLIGVETLPPQDQDYELVLTGFDKAQNKPLGYFSGTRTWLGKGALHPTPICINGTCYLQSKMDPGDYIIFQLVVANSPTFLGKGGLLTGRLVTSRNMSKGTYMFHVEPGKITYAGTYIIYSDMTAVDRAFNGGQTADSHPGEHGEPEPTLTYKMDVGAAQMALKSFKGADVEMVSRDPEQVTFSQ